MNTNNIPNPNNNSEWITHAEHEERRGISKLTKHTNPSLWAMLARHGAEKPHRTAIWWNDWAANNPTPEVKALAKLDVAGSLTSFVKGVTTGARPVNW
tara:strand:- start:517 stop:810 length:294 start_codon:yes stop_codon:yes gene_type:complete